MSLEITEDLIARQSPEAQAIIRLLLARIAELEARLNKTPQNSSLPPSTQHPHAKPQPPKAKSKKRRGGQPGHAKHERTLLPTEECDDVQSLKPEACRRCGTRLSGTDPEPLRHQVWELPDIKPLVTEYQLHRLECVKCGESTCAELPPGVPAGQAGPRLVALAALLMAYFRQSKRRTARFLETILGQPCCPAWTVKLQKQATDALRLTRAATVLTEHLTDRFCGVVMCDRAKMYWSLGCLQWCWAHLKRDFQALIDSHDPQVKRLGHDLMRPTRKLFAAWARYRDGTLTRAGMKRLLSPIRAEIEGLLLRGAFSGNERLLGMCNELYDHRQWLWTFLDQEGVEPTNNGSERALRHAVIWRKLSFGTQSASGSRFVETMLTVIETCRQQGRNTFTFVADAVHAHFAGRPPASLLAGV